MKDFKEKNAGRVSGAILEIKNGMQERSAAPLIKATDNGNDPQTTETATPYEIYNNNIEYLTTELIEREYNNKTPEELKQDKSFFPRLIQYLYNNYLGDLFQNSLEYKIKRTRPVYPDIKQLDDIFNLYVTLIYKYKWNNRPSILEYSLLTGISRETLYSWLNGNIDKDTMDLYAGNDRRKYITKEYADTVAKWQTTCEQALIDGNGEYVKEIFLLKAKHGYKDNNNDIQITVNHKTLIDADILPDLIAVKEQ